MNRVRWIQTLTLIAGAALLLLVPGPAEAQQLIYRPTNPAFGGNPLNGQWLLSNASAQKTSEDRDPFARDPLEDFQQGLQRQILSAISRELVFSQFGGDLDLTQAGRYELGDFVLEIIPGLTGVDIIVTNALTGAQSLVTIPNY